MRAETTKNRLERVVPYSASTGVLMMSRYLLPRGSPERPQRSARRYCRTQTPRQALVADFSA